MLDINHFSAAIEGKKILRNISLSFEQGKVYAILGPNGSGKSTLASAIMGRPDIVPSPESDILFEGNSIVSLTPEKRARLGIFLSFQNPPALAGISVFSFAKAALPDEDPLRLKNRIASFSNELGISESLRFRGIHDGFSGGEKKKFEALLWAIFAPKIAFFDEIDTGVDVDAVKIIGSFIRNHRSPEQTLVFITHSTALLGTTSPDQTVVMKDGSIERIETGNLAHRILNEDGFGAVSENESEIPPKP